MNNKIIDQLSGHDLRSIGQSNTVVNQIADQPAFDELFDCLFHKNRIIVMHSADVIEKVTRMHPEYLVSHKIAILSLLEHASNKEFKWHLALLTPRLHLAKIEIAKTWRIMTNWALDGTESKIVRVNAIQALHDILKQFHMLQTDYDKTIEKIQLENIPSINARIRKLKKKPAYIQPQR